MLASLQESPERDAQPRSGTASVAGALAAIDMEDLAGHEARGFEVEDRVDDVGDLAHTADRVQGGELRLAS